MVHACHCISFRQTLGLQAPPWAERCHCHLCSSQGRTRDADGAAVSYGVLGGLAALRLSRLGRSGVELLMESMSSAVP